MNTCYNSSCVKFCPDYADMTHCRAYSEVKNCPKVVLKDQQEDNTNKHFVNLSEATFEDLSIIILDRSFQYWFRKDALKEYDSRHESIDKRTEVDKDAV